MSTEIQKAQAHTILPVERLGDTLLVTPHGDLAGYSPLTFQDEFQRVKTILKDASLKNLIIDLGSSRYFGSEMIGALVSWREQVIGRGRVALAEVSPDTLVGLQTVKADTLFEIIPTRATAIHQIPTLTVGERLARFRRPLIALACLLLAAVVIWGSYATRVNYKLFGSRTARTYDAILKQWNRLEHGESRWAAEESRTYRAEMATELEKLGASVRGKHLYHVNEDYWLNQAITYFQNVLNNNDSQRGEFYRAMRYARLCIAQRTGIQVRHVGPEVEDEDEEPPEPPPDAVERDEPDAEASPLEHEHSDELTSGDAVDDQSAAGSAGESTNDLPGKETP